MFTTDMENQERFTTAQHNRYKPRLDYMVEKYGEEFTIDDYGAVTSVNHPGWSIDVHYAQREERYNVASYSADPKRFFCRIDNRAGIC